MAADLDSARETLLAELREQAGRFGVEPRDCRVQSLQREGEGFIARLAGADCRGDADAAAAYAPAPSTLAARRVILATGVLDGLPPLDGCEAAIRAGVVRLCAICDGYETAGRRVAVYGPPAKVAGHARYMRTYCEDVSALVADGHLEPGERAKLEALGIRVLEGCAELVWDGRREVRVTCASGEDAGFDVFYPVLGARSQSQLAVALGAECTKEGDLVVDDHQRTSVPGLYAIGDVVSALNQISVGYGHAAIAATDVHNELSLRPL